MPRAWLGLVVFFAAQAAGATFHFVILGDRTGRATPGVYEQAWREAAKTRPDFAITVGDAIEGWNGSQALHEWESVKRSWMPDVPVYHTPGNHDIWDAASEKLYIRETGRPPFYSFDFEQAHFVVLDNSRTDDLSSSQIEFLRSDLRVNRGKAPVFIFFHRPFWLIPLKLGANGLVLHRIAREYGVCCVVSGHGHQLQSVVKEGVLYLEVGSSGASLAGAGPAGIGYDEGWFYQYAYVGVKGKTVTFEVRELGAPFGQGRAQELNAGQKPVR